MAVAGLDVAMRLQEPSGLDPAFWPLLVLIGVSVIAVAALGDVESYSLIDPPAYVLAMVAVTWHLSANLSDYGALYSQGLVGEGSVYAAYVVLPMSIIAAPVGAIIREWLE